MDDDIWEPDATQCCVCKTPVRADRQHPSKWEKVRAHYAGWFFQNDGTTFCPAHVPDWVESWREGR